MSKREKGSEWPLGDVLREARGTMSQREAARRADISPSRWRQVEQGYQEIAGGRIPINVKPSTVAAMALAVGADAANALQLAGHDPARHADLIDPALMDLPENVRAWFTRLPASDRTAVVEKLQRLDADTAAGEPRRASGS